MVVPLDLTKREEIDIIEVQKFMFLEAKVGRLMLAEGNFMMLLNHAVVYSDPNHIYQLMIDWGILQKTIRQFNNFK